MKIKLIRILNTYVRADSGIIAGTGSAHGRMYV